MNKLAKITNRFLSEDANARALQISGFVRFAIIIFQGIILVKLGLDPYFIAIVESFYFLFNISRYYFLSGGKYAGFSKMKDSDNPFTEIFWGFNILGLFAGIVGALVVFFGVGEFDSFLTLEYVKYGLPFLLFLSLPVDTYDLLYIQRKSPKTIINYTLVIGLFQAAGLVYLLTNGYHMGHVVLYFLLLYTLRWVHLCLESTRNSTFVLSQSWTFVIFALPLILHSLFSGLTDYIDGWLIKSFFEDSDFAKYRYGARELPLNSILIGAVVSGLILRQSAIALSVKAEIIKLLKFLTPLLAFLILLSPWLFQLFYSADYKISALYFNLYALLILSHAIFVQVYFYRENDRWLLTLISLVEVLCNIGMSIYLLNQIGILGIPIATLIVDFAFRLGMMAIVKLRYGTEILSYYPWKSHVLSMMLLFSCFGISYYLHFSS